MSTTSVLILGLGRSGKAVAEYCAARPDRFGPIMLADSGDTSSLHAAAGPLRAIGVELHLATEKIEGSWDLCVASPGIPPHALLMASAREAATEVVSEIEFAARESTHRWVAVTGTNGKTTTTALVAHLLRASGIEAVAVGNIGSPAITAVDEMDDSTVLVAEVSSFQLALTQRFHPSVAILLNITPDHTDWHGSLEKYAADKAKVFDNLVTGDTAVIDVDDPGSAAYVALAGAKGARVARVSVRSADAEARLDDGVLTLAEGEETIGLVSTDELLIQGPHNFSNALAAAIAARAAGADVESIRQGLKTFRPIEHRLEPAGVVSGIEWFNDSKATNPDAVFKAIDSFANRPFVLLLGGQNKGNDFHELARAATAKARASVVFGEAAVEFAAAFADIGAQVAIATGMEDAMKAALSLAQPGDAVVLSPACASFDEFDNYEHRGREFKRIVAEMSDVS